VEAAPDGDGLCFVFTLPLSQFIASTLEESSTVDQNLRMHGTT
jgi:hypothetical protein